MGVLRLTEKLGFTKIGPVVSLLNKPDDNSIINTTRSEAHEIGKFSWEN